MQVPLRPSGILSATVVPTVCFGQFQLSIPAQPSGYPASPVMFAKGKGIHLRRTEQTSLEGTFMRALGDNQPSSAEERRSELGRTI